MDDERKILTEITRLGSKIEAVSDRIEWIANNIEDHEKRIRNLESDSTADHEARLRSLEGWRSTMVGKIAVVMLIITSFVSAAVAWVSSW